MGLLENYFKCKLGNIENKTGQNSEISFYFTLTSDRNTFNG